MRTIDVVFLNGKFDGAVVWINAEDYNPAIHALPEDVVQVDPAEIVIIGEDDEGDLSDEDLAAILSEDDDDEE